MKTVMKHNSWNSIKCANISKHYFYYENSNYSKVRLQNIKYVTCPDLTFMKNDLVLRTQIKVFMLRKKIKKNN